MRILGLFFQFPGALHPLLGKSALYLETTGLNSWKGEGLQGIQKIALNGFSYLVFQGRFGRLILQTAVFMLGNASCSSVSKTSLS